MTRLKTTAALLGAAALTLTLGACGGGGGEYCDLISDSESTFGSIESADPTDPEALGDMANTIQEIADAAPSDIQGDWNTLSEAIQALADAEGDPTAIDPEALGDIDTATTNISENVQEECDITLE